MNYNTKIVEAKDLHDPKNIKPVINSLMYGAYKSNRDQGMSHEWTVRLGFGNDAMKALYEQQNQNNGN
jgi:hypothetical protein